MAVLQGRSEALLLEDFAQRHAASLRPLPPFPASRGVDTPLGASFGRPPLNRDAASGVPRELPDTLGYRLLRAPDVPKNGPSGAFSPFFASDVPVCGTSGALMQLTSDTDDMPQ